MATTDPIVSFKEAHEIGKFFFECQQLLVGQAEQGYGMSVWSVDYYNDYPANTDLAYSSVDFFYQRFNSTDSADPNFIGTQYYIRLGRFIDFLQVKIIPNINYDVDIKLVNTDTTLNTNIMYTPPRVISSDPGVCYIKNTYPVDGVNYYFAPLASDFIVPFNDSSIKYSYGYVMNIYFNMGWILQRIDSLKDNNGKISLYGLLNTLCQGYNQSTGNFSKLEPVIDTETNTIKILDNVALPDRDNILKSPLLSGSLLEEVSTETVIFDTYGYVYGTGANGDPYQKGVPHASFITDLRFNTTVSPNLATMIVVGSTNQGYVVGEDATALSRMNNGLTDRFKEKITTPDSTPNQPLPPLAEKYSAAIRAFNNYVSTIGTPNENTTPSYNSANVDDFKSLQTQLLEYYQAAATDEAAKENSTAASANTGFLPFDLSLTMDGISGMKVYQKFAIESGFLPTNYPRTLEFLIKGITHTISNNRWTTNIESMAIPKNPFGATIDDNFNTSYRGTALKSFTDNLTLLSGNYSTSNDNNPFNLRPLRGSNQFNGSIGKKEGFKGGSSIGYFIVFDTLQNGVRAGMKNLSNYFTKYKRDTISKIINAYAPGGTPGQSSSRTANYVNLITDYMKANYSSSITSTTKLTFNGASETNQNNIKMFKTLVKGILKQEGGLTPEVETLINNFVISSLR
jgi:hypothetical protein